MAVARWGNHQSRRSFGAPHSNGRRSSQQACAPECDWCQGSDTEMLAARVATLQSCALFSGLNISALTEIARASEIRPVRARRTLFEEGDQCEGLWIVAKGHARLHHTDFDGRQFVMKFCEPGEAIQLSPAVDGGTHGLGGTAQEDSVFLLIPAAVIHGAIQTNPEFAQKTINALCLILRRVNVGATTREFLDAPSRIRCALIRFAYEYGVRSAGGVRIDYRLTRQDIADCVGVTVETAIRVLSQMQHDGVLTSDDARLIEIPDFEGLQRSAGCDSCQFDCRAIFNRVDHRSAPASQSAASSPVFRKARPQ